MRLVLIGAPASGKGTQGAKLSKYFNIPSISVGQLLREVSTENSERGKLVKSLIDFGNLAPTELTISLIKERVSKPDCKNGYILDGFPRDLEQAKSLDINEIDKVLYLTVNKANMVKRIMGRGRIDDTKKTLENRIKIFKNLTVPVIEHYKKHNKVVTINANKKVDEVFNEIVEALK